MPEDFAFLEGEIEGMRQQLSTMLGRLDALQVQLDNARAQLDAQGNNSSLPSHYPIWREAMMPASPRYLESAVQPATGAGASAASEQISWEVVFCSAVMLASTGYYLTLLLPHILDKMP